MYLNSFEGPIPLSVGDLDLRELLVGNNLLTGTITPLLFRNTNLVILQLHNNFFEGSLSEDISALLSLRDLRINDNMLSSTLPTALASLSNLGKMQQPRSSNSADGVQLTFHFQRTFWSTTTSSPAR